MACRSLETFAVLAPCGGDDEILALSNSLKYSVIAMAEELKVKRKLLTESEKQVRELLLERCDLVTQREDLTKRLSKLEVVTSKVEPTAGADQLDRQRVASMEMQKAELAVITKELSAMKEEVKKLRTDERGWRLKEKEMQLKVDLGAAGKAECTARLDVLDSVIKVIRGELQKLNNVQQKLEEDVNEAMQLNVSAKEQINHHKCIAEFYEQQCDELKKALVETRVQSTVTATAKTPSSLPQPTGLENEIRRLRLENEALQSKLKSTEEAHRGTLEILANMAKMISKDSIIDLPIALTTSSAEPEVRTPESAAGSNDGIFPNAV